ncbi:MAG: methionine--tRNA ligase subunit beta, partial [Deltaproteobacteria bacterium]|nr:methionine--tRNA ligase subunit beta [Deltaproteobacteria bacterium]
SFKAYCKREGVDFDAYWGLESKAELYHFIGKDIAYFHTLFWPAMLHGAGFRKPSAVFVHGFLTVDGKKMSKSRGTFIMARTYLEHLNPEWLRYYYAAKLTSGVSDIDLSLEDFRLRVNSDLVGKLVNIASRCAGFISKRFDGKLAATLPEPGLYEEIVAAGDEIAAAYEGRDFSKAIRSIMALADRANVYIDEKKPWALVKDDATLPEAHAVCTQGINMFRALVAYLKPVLPRLAAGTEAFLKIESMDWHAAKTPLLDHVVDRYKPLMQRVDEKQIAKMVEGSKAAEEDAPAAEKTPLEADPIADEISFDDFAKVDLRVAQVVAADLVKGAGKLLELKLDLGGETRTVFAGIKKAFPDPKVLEGRMVVMVANLAPRKMRFGLSEGMVIAAGEGDQVFLLTPDEGAKPGQRLS